MIDVKNKAKPIGDEWKQAAHVSLAGIETPFYVFLAGRIAGNLKTFENSFRGENRQIDFFYSIKTNPALEILSIIREAGWGLLASSEGDIEIAKQIKAGANLIFDAPYKRQDELLCAVRNLKAVLVCENVSDLEKLVRVARNSGALKAGLRIMIPSQVSGHLSRFGFDMNSVTNKNLLEKMRQLSAVVRVSSLHFHLGGLPASPKQFDKLAEFASGIWRNFSSHGFKIDTLDLGGGFPCSLAYDGLSKYARAILKGLKNGGVPDSVIILFEPGRAIVENAGALCVKVVDLSTRHGELFALVDGGSNLVMPAWMLNGRKRKIRKLNSSQSRAPKYPGPITVVGPLCAENDIIGQIEETSEVSVGDILIIEDCGAYDWSTRYHFNGKMPAAYLVDEAGRFEIMR